MALINCPECGKEISDKAISCPNCGCPASEFVEDVCPDMEIQFSQKKRIEIKDGKMRLLFRDKSYPAYDIKSYTLCSDKLTLGIEHDIYIRNDNVYNGTRIVFSSTKGSPDYEKSYELCDLLRKYATCEGDTRDAREKRAEEKAQRKEARAWFCETFSSNGGSNTVRCPKCKSTSISYGNKPSIGRAVVGGALAGAAGATIGGLTGKKGYAVCMNCGKRWKI